MRILDRIDTPADVAELNMEELKALAQEIRTLLVEVTAQNGGHLAPNLGVVELTLALYYVYHDKNDQIVWDVGHQSYVHKILTGRRESIKSVRTYNGLSGFPKISESPYDAFGTGHSSTSISAALGLAIARDLKGDNYQVTAVIGDGALTGGMAYEALNNAGHLQSKMLVILNDNEMSIDHNVGGLSDYLNRVRSDANYIKGKEDVEEFLKRIPNLGGKMLKMADKMKDSLKYLLVPGTIFEEMGFKYFGPIDGHNLKDLIDILENVKHLNRPVLVHVITKKGKGYLPAEQNPEKFHGVGPFDIATGELKKVKINPTYTEIFSRTLIRLGREDEKILAITAAMGAGTGINDFAKIFPKRTFDVGIAEEHAVTMAAALAVGGFKPVVAIYSTFLQRSYDQLIHDVALQKAPVVLALDRAGLVGDDGATHHGVFDLSYLRSIPEMIIMSPKDENGLQHMLYSALKYNRPTAVRFPRGEGHGVLLDDDLQFYELGKSEALAQGNDVVFLAVGSMVETAWECADILSQKNISAGIINMRFVKPLDEEAVLKAAEEAKLLVTMEENILQGGFGSGVLELLAKADKKVRVLTIGIDNCFAMHGNAELLKHDLGLDAESIADKVLARLAYSPERA